MRLIDFKCLSFLMKIQQTQNNLPPILIWQYKFALEDIAFYSQSFWKSPLKTRWDNFDKTGLAKIFGSQTFCKIIGTNKKLPSETIESSILKKKIFEKVEHVYWRYIK